MAKKILSFEEYQVQLKAEQDNVDTTEEVENEECPCGEDEEGNCLECEDDVVVMAPAEDDDEEDESEESEEEESEEAPEEGGEEAPEAEAEAAPAEAPATVEEMLIEGYNKVKEAACAYEKDEYQDHTLEMYMKENAALVAALAAKAMEEGYGEVKEMELTQEMYEAHCNEMKEAYGKKMDELKETYGAGKE